MVVWQKGAVADVLAGLDPEQRAAAEALRGPVCILAGAGTGKTRAITHRIAHAVRSGAVEASHVLAVTFTTRAAGELRGRLRALGITGVQARTFHAAALRQLQYFWPRAVGGGMPAVATSKVRLLAEVASQARMSLSPSDLRDVAGEIEWMKALQRPPDDYATSAAIEHRVPPRPPDQIATLYAGYEDLKARKHLIDFEDLLLHATALLETEPEVAATVREQYRYFVVDEYQDVNPAQQRLLDAWLGGRDDLCVVGDPQQTIYSFAGAAPRYLTGFSARYPAATVLQLVRDYRSSPQVVALANRLCRGGLVAQRPPGPLPTLDGYDDEVAEAAAVAGRAAQLIAAGTPASQIAVLFRVNAQSETFEQAFADAGVPYLVRGGERFFERREVREAIFLLRGAARAAPANGPADDHANGHTDEDGLAEAVKGVLAGMGFTDASPAGTGAARERWESLAALIRLAEQHPPGDESLASFVAELDERAALQHAPVADGVTLASLHAAKGLEWDAVFLVGLVEGTLPIVYAETPDQIEEERRLLYVGITRARTVLALSWAAARSPGGRASRRPSRFLADLTPALADRRPAPASHDRRGRRERSPSGPLRCRVCGRVLTSGAERKLARCLGCPGDVDEALFARLRAWRLERSQQLKQPAYCVFTDATLTRIAELRPSTREELSRIGGVGPVKLAAYAEEVLALCGPGDQDGRVPDPGGGTSTAGGSGPGGARK